MTWNIPLADIDFGEEEAIAVQKVLKSRWLTMGAVTQEFENAVARYNQVEHAIAVTNATAALHLACLAIGLEAGDEVIVPSLTFVASANAIRYTGAIPVFADIVSTEDLNISPEAIDAQITERTRAIMVVHYGGYACDMQEIQSICQRYHLSLIEDAAHAIGSELEGKKLGCWGSVGCYSFFSNKNMTTGEGGMAVTADERLAKKIRLLRSHGMTTLTWDRHQGHAWGYDVVDLGFNYRIDEIRAALGIAQLSKLEKNNEIRRNLTSTYHAVLEEMIPEIILPFKTYRGKSAAHILPVILPDGVDRIKVMEYLKQKGIQTSNHYPPIHLFTSYQNGKKYRNLEVTEEVARRELTLPLFPAMTTEDVLIIVNALKAAIYSD